MGLLAQQGNPFEIHDRIKAEAPIGVDSHFVAKTTNPFEKTKTDNVSSSTRRKERMTIAPAKDSQLTPTSVFWILSFLTLLLAIIINLNRDLIPNLMRSWSNANYANFLRRDKKQDDALLYSVLSLIFYINLALFIALALDRLIDYHLSIGQIGLLATGILCIYLVRHGILRFLAGTFSVEKEALQYSFTITTFNILLGLVLLLGNALLAYSSITLAKSIIYSIVIIIALQYAYRLIRGLLNSAKFLVGSKIHFFLYLCTCEIAPLLILTTYLTRLG